MAKLWSEWCVGHVKFAGTKFFVRNFTYKTVRSHKQQLRPPHLAPTLTHHYLSIKYMPWYVCHLTAFLLSPFWQEKEEAILRAYIRMYPRCIRILLVYCIGISTSASRKQVRSHQKHQFDWSTNGNISRALTMTIKLLLEVI